MVELLVVLTIVAVTLVVVGSTFNGYLDRSSARRAAEQFGQDLKAARNSAARSRRTVVVDFNETSLEYLIRIPGGDTLYYRFFDGDSDLTLSGLDLQMTGDSVAFDSRGVADLSGASGSLGRAEFTAGNATYAVSFNSMGSSRVNGS